MEFLIGRSEDVQPANFTSLWRQRVMFSYNAYIHIKKRKEKERKRNKNQKKNK